MVTTRVHVFVKRTFMSCFHWCTYVIQPIPGRRRINSALVGMNYSALLSSFVVATDKWAGRYNDASAAALAADLLDGSYPSLTVLPSCCSCCHNYRYSSLSTPSRALSDARDTMDCDRHLLILRGSAMTPQRHALRTPLRAKLPSHRTPRGLWSCRCAMCGAVQRVTPRFAFQLICIHRTQCSDRSQRMIASNQHRCR